MWLFLFQKYIQYVISLKEISNPHIEKSALSKELIFGKQELPFDLSVLVMIFISF